MSSLKVTRVEQSSFARDIGSRSANRQYFSAADEKKAADTFVREIIQNSTDNNVDDRPVKVKFELININTNEIPGLEEIKETLKAILKGEKENYSNDTEKIKEREKFAKLFDEDKVLCLKISDYNTKGLDGDVDDEKSTCYRLLSSEGHYDENSGGGGSGGVGKMAAYMFSQPELCFYSSKNKKDEYFYYGRLNAVTHKIKDTKYTDIVFANNKGKVRKEKIKDRCFLNSRDESGLDIFTMCPNKELIDNIQKNNYILKGVIRNFFAKIHDGELEVEINLNGEKKTINTKTLNNYIENEKIFTETNPKRGRELLSDSQIINFYKAYTMGDEFKSDEFFQLQKNKKGNYTKSLGVCKIKLIKRGEYNNSIMRIRKPKMLIEESKKNSIVPFNMIFICDSDKGNKILKESESSKHNQWFKTTTGSKKKKELWNKIKKEIRDFEDAVIQSFNNTEENTSIELDINNIFFTGHGNNSNKLSEKENEEETGDLEVDKSGIISDVKRYTSGIIINPTRDIDGDNGPPRPPRPPRPPGPTRTRRIKPKLETHMFSVDGGGEYKLYTRSTRKSFGNFLRFSALDGQNKAIKNLNIIKEIFDYKNDEKIHFHEKKQAFGPFDFNKNEQREFKLKTRYKRNFKININIIH